MNDSTRIELSNLNSSEQITVVYTDGRSYTGFLASSGLTGLTINLSVVDPGESDFHVVEFKNVDHVILKSRGGEARILR